MVCSPNSQDPLWGRTFRSILNANIVTSMCCFLVEKVGFGDSCWVARFCDQYWSTFRPVLVHTFYLYWFAF